MSRTKLPIDSTGTAPERGAPPRTRRNWAPLVSGAGSLALFAVGAHSLVLLSEAANAPVADASAGNWTRTPIHRPELYPPAPGVAAISPNTGGYPGMIPGAPANPAVPSTPVVPGAPGAAGPMVGAVVPRITVPSGSGTGGGLPGRIGPMGPVTGPLNTDVSGLGPVRGPYYGGKPLPSISGGVAGAPPPALPGTPVAVAPRVSPAVAGDVSELPTERTVALSRLANPLLQTRTANGTPNNAAAPKADVSAEKPLSVSLSVGKGSVTVGDAVPVRMSANMDCYAAIFRLDASGNASVLFRWGAPSRSFACLLRPTSAGQEQLVVVASVNPLNGADAAAAVRGAGAGFAVAPASSLGGGSKGWQRHEWSVATASLTVAAPAKVAAVKPSATKSQEKSEPAVPKTAASKVPAGRDGSTLPTTLPEKSEMRPVVEKPAEKPEAPPAKEEMKPVQPASVPNPKNEMKPVGTPAEKPAESKPGGSEESEPAPGE